MDGRFPASRYKSLTEITRGNLAKSLVTRTSVQARLSQIRAARLEANCGRAQDSNSPPDLRNWRLRE